jgi:hypothetical protein
MNTQNGQAMDPAKEGSTQRITRRQLFRPLIGGLSGKRLSLKWIAERRSLGESFAPNGLTLVTVSKLPAE